MHETAKSAKKPGVLEIIMALLVCSGVRISKEHEKEAIIIILAFYFSAPFSMFLVRDHFSCKCAPLE